MSLPMKTRSHSSMAAAANGTRVRFLHSDVYVLGGTHGADGATHLASPYRQLKVQNVAKNFSFIAIVTLGVNFVTITCRIDLSIGSLICFAAIITSLVMSTRRCRVERDMIIIGHQHFCAPTIRGWRRSGLAPIRRAVAPSDLAPLLRAESILVHCKETEEFFLADATPFVIRVLGSRRTRCWIDAQSSPRLTWGQSSS